MESLWIALGVVQPFIVASGALGFGVLFLLYVFVQLLALIPE